MIILGPFNSLRSRLLWGIGVPLLALQLAVVALEYGLERREGLVQMRQELGTLTRLVAARIDQALSLVVLATRTKARALAENPQLNQPQRVRLLQADISDKDLTIGSTLVLRRRPPHFRERFEVFVARDRGGVVRADPARIAALTPAWLERAWNATQGFWSAPYRVGVESGGTLISYAVPVDGHPSLDAVLSADVPVERLRSVLRDADFESGGFAILDRFGSTLAVDEAAPFPAERVARWIDPLFSPDAAADQRAGARVLQPDAAATGDARWWIFLAPIPATGWVLMATVDEHSALASVESRLLRQGVVYAGASAVILALLAWLSARATRPLIPLAEAARKAAAGDLDTRVAGPLARDEIGRFGAIFNRMMADLQANVAGRIEAVAARQAVESELEMAREIQQTLLPAPFPSIADIAIATRFVPARHVAGDFYDHFQLDSSTLVVAIADVSGKGVAAALFMSAARTSLRNFSRAGVGPGETLKSVNRALFQDNRHLVFVTAFVAHYHIPTGRLIYANAGHNIPYRVRADGTPEPMGDATGPLLAVFEKGEFADREARLEPGETLVLYTDGVVEAGNADGELYGEARLESLLRRNAGESPDGLCVKITASVQAHCGGAPQDDVTLLLLRRPSPLRQGTERRSESGSGSFARGSSARHPDSVRPVGGGALVFAPRRSTNRGAPFLCVSPSRKPPSVRLVT